MTINNDHRQFEKPKFNYVPIFIGASTGTAVGVGTGAYAGLALEVLALACGSRSLGRVFTRTTIACGIVGSGAGAILGLSSSAAIYGYRRYKATKLDTTNKDN